MPWEFKTLTSQCVQHLSWMNSVTSSALCCQCCFLTDSGNISQLVIQSLLKRKYFQEIGYAWLCYVTAGIVPNIYCTPLTQKQRSSESKYPFLLIISICSLCSLRVLILWDCVRWNVYGCGSVAVPKLHKAVLGSALDPIKVEFSRPQWPTQDFWGPIQFPIHRIAKSHSNRFLFYIGCRNACFLGNSRTFKNIWGTMCSAFQEMWDYCPNQSSRFLNDATSEDPAALPFAPGEASFLKRRAGLDKWDRNSESETWAVQLLVFSKLRRLAKQLLINDVLTTTQKTFSKLLDASPQRARPTKIDLSLLDWSILGPLGNVNTCESCGFGNVWRLCTHFTPLPARLSLDPPATSKPRFSTTSISRSKSCPKTYARC